MTINKTGSSLTVVFGEPDLIQVVDAEVLLAQYQQRSLPADRTPGAFMRRDTSPLVVEQHRPNLPPRAETRCGQVVVVEGVGLKQVGSRHMTRHGGGKLMGNVLLNGNMLLSLSALLHGGKPLRVNRLLSLSALLHLAEWLGGDRLLRVGERLKVTLLLYIVQLLREIQLLRGIELCGVVLHVAVLHGVGLLHIVELPRGVKLLSWDSVLVELLTGDLSESWVDPGRSLTWSDSGRKVERRVVEAVVPRDLQASRAITGWVGGQEVLSTEISSFCPELVEPFKAVFQQIIRHGGLCRVGVD
jgi:hypothetical protein